MMVERCDNESDHAKWDTQFWREEREKRDQSMTLIPGHPMFSSVLVRMPGSSLR